MKKPSISVFFPCFNDSKTISKLVRDSFSVLPTLASDYEVVVIDDGSSDGSRNVLKRLEKKYSKLKLVFHEKNRGYGGALKSGFANSTKDLVFYTDGDGQYDVKELPILIGLMGDDVDFVNGLKMSRRDPTYRIVIGNIYNFLARWLFWLPIVDIDCDFRLIRKSLIKKIKLESDSGPICIELVKKAQLKGAIFRQVSIHHYERQFGQSQFFKLNHLFRTSWELGHLWLKLISQKNVKN